MEKPIFDWQADALNNYPPVYIDTFSTGVAVTQLLFANSFSSVYIDILPSLNKEQCLHYIYLVQKVGVHGN
jgi:hypothetical protein